MDSHLSKSEKKRRAKGLEQLVNELAALSLADINALPCEQEVRDEIASVRNLKGGARKRQLKYATKLLREKSVDELYDFLSRKKGSMLKEKHQFHEIEHFRNLLIAEAVQHYDEVMHSNGYMNEGPAEILPEMETLQAIINRLPLVDEAHLKKSVTQFVRTRNRKFSREVFRTLKAAMEKSQFMQK